MRIFINSKEVAIKKGTSFEYVSENRLFSDADDFSLQISLPLKDSPQNLNVFGNIFRSDVAPEKISFSCEIQDAAMYKRGIAVITDFDDAEVKIQFLQGRSEQNYNDSIDDIYINECDLGKPPETKASLITVNSAWNPADRKYVALPWLRDSGGENIQNLTDFKDGEYSWDNKTVAISFQPFLHHIVSAVCDAIGFEDRTGLADNQVFKNYIICNALPAVWDLPDFKFAMPHWSAREFFKNLELFLGGEFDFDFNTKSVSFVPYDSEKYDNVVYIDRIVDEFSSSVHKEDQIANYIAAKNIGYDGDENDFWACASCRWFIDLWENKIEVYDTYSELVTENQNYLDFTHYLNPGSEQVPNFNRILYAQDVDLHFVFRIIKCEYLKPDDMGNLSRIHYVTELVKINQFGDRMVADKNKDHIEKMKILPARVDDTEPKYGPIVFLPLGDYDDFEGEIEEGTQDSPYTLKQTVPFFMIKQGQKDKTQEFFSKIFIAYWDGSKMPSAGYLPHPEIDDVILPDTNGAVAGFYPEIRPFSFRLQTTRPGKGSAIGKMPEINMDVKYSFKFISDKLPDVRSVFQIAGKRYICEKLTATFTEYGMSQLVKGEFYPVED